MKHVSILILAGTLFAGTAVWADADQGKDLFQKKCTMCHAAGKPAGDLKSSKLDKKALCDKLATPPKGMPAFKGTDAERDSLVDYMMSLRK
ncbi:MAG: hypothetical protein A3H42_05435 [Deltaproteobacteria bacterium RIFCSPLOWO2_02_FULL_46_8]|nr:MAG: hypothetical protein A3H42_05435 [Deltaproteobacteria bacterium RIFCSPLOWO2_02_FULL_46_8]